MTKTQHPIHDQAKAASPEPVSGEAVLALGDTLKQAREDAGLSIEEIASKTHIDVKHLRNIEQNAFDEFYSAVFLKGYIKSYAQLLGVDFDREMPLFEQHFFESKAPQKGQLHLLKAQMPHGMLNIGIYVALSLLLIALLTWSYQQINQLLSDDQRSLIPSTQAAEDVDVYGVLAHEALAVVGDESISSQAKQAPLIVDMTDTMVMQDMQLIANLPVSSDVQTSLDNEKLNHYNNFDALVIQVKEDSWIEVLDANGKRLFMNLARAGKTIELLGEQPFQLHVGFAPGLMMHLNGEPFPIVNFRNDNSARLQIASKD